MSGLSHAEDRYESSAYRPPAVARWNGWWFVLAQLPYFALFTMSRFPPIRLPHGFAQPLNAMTTLFGYGIALTVVVVCSRRRGSGRLNADFGWDVQPVDVAYGIVGLVAVTLTAALIGVLLHPLGPVTPNFHLGADRAWNVVGVFFVPVIVAAPVEELMFRGLLMRWLRNLLLRTGTGEPSVARHRAAIHLSVIGSATVFALMHLYEAPDFASAVALGLNALCFGLIAGYLATLTGRLGPAVLTHGLHNALVAATAIMR